MFKKGKGLLCMAVALILVSSLVGCGGGPAASSQSENSSLSASAASSEAPASETDALNIKGTKIRYAMILSPDDTNVGVWNGIIENYTAQSDVKVEFEYYEKSNFRTWLTTQHVANNAPDVCSMSFRWAWDDYDKGYMLDLAPYLDQPNPYYDNKILRDTINPNLYKQAQNPSDGSYSILPGSVVSTRIIYNKDLFAQAGVALPSPYFTFNEFMDACKKLQDIGATPYAFANSKIDDAFMNWWMHNLVSQMDKSSRDQMDMDGDGMITKNEMAAGTDNGLIDYSQSPFKDAFAMLKEFSQYWNSDFNSTDSATAIDLFLGGRVAMTSVGSWTKHIIDQYEGIGFEYGIMMYPAVTEENYPGATATPLNNGGKIIDAYTATKSGDPLKEAASVDFMMYLMSSEPNIACMNQLASTPPIMGIELSENLAAWIPNENEDILHCSYFGNSTSKEFATFQVLSSQVWLVDKMTQEDYMNELNTEWTKMIEDAKEAGGWTKENGYGTK